MSRQFIVLDEDDKRKIAENEIVICRLNNGLKVHIVSEVGFSEWCKIEKPSSLEFTEGGGENE